MAHTHRQCSIEIENTSIFILCNERSHSVSGFCDIPLPSRLDPSKVGSGRFVKTPDTACGAVGVFTYDIYQEFEDQYIGKIAVMFSNPYDFAVYSNWYAVGVFSMEKLCDHELYKEMYYEENMGFVKGKASEGSLTYRGSSVAITANMSDSYEPVLKVQVYND
ncbi:DELTA-sagatoxin-Srs1a-like [Alosa alosa]|uniref:DELTA-sagatoxin-Srs1a-like n=1 Tax=Alosa alosa TaxID=278164 RepID=UPI00201515E9|nr:DELTA-sagatoxin-Srs1a-like [Alosa alosa]